MVPLESHCVHPFNRIHHSSNWRLNREQNELNPWYNAFVRVFRWLRSTWVDLFLTRTLNWIGMISLISSKFDFDITVFTVEYEQSGRTLVSGDAILDSQTLVADLFTTPKCTLHRHDRGTWLPQSSYSTMEHLFEQRCIIQWHQPPFFPGSILFWGMDGCGRDST